MGQVGILQRVVREGLPVVVAAFRQESEGMGSDGTVLKAKAIANAKALGQESLAV